MKARATVVVLPTAAPESLVERTGRAVLTNLDKAREVRRQRLADRRLAILAALGEELARDRIAGYPQWGRSCRLHAAIHKRHGVACSRRTVARLLREHFGVVAKS